MKSPLWSAVTLLSERRHLSPPLADIRVLRRMASLGFASQTGRLFHVLPACARMAALLATKPESPQQELFA